MLGNWREDRQLLVREALLLVFADLLDYLVELHFQPLHVFLGYFILLDASYDPLLFFEESLAPVVLPEVVIQLPAGRPGVELAQILALGNGVRILYI